MSQQTYAVEMTEDEIEVLRAIAYYVVGGCPKGPRRHVESLLGKLVVYGNRTIPPRRYAAEIVTSERFGNPRVVIEERT